MAPFRVSGALPGGRSRGRRSPSPRAAARERQIFLEEKKHTMTKPQSRKAAKPRRRACITRPGKKTVVSVIAQPASPRKKERNRVLNHATQQRRLPKNDNVHRELCEHCKRHCEVREAVLRVQNPKNRFRETRPVRAPRSVSGAVVQAL